MLQVQEYLKSFSDPQVALNSLAVEPYNIKVNQYFDRVVLNYSQTDSPKFHPIIKECRGLILSYPDFKIMCKSFDRFYNYGEQDPNDVSHEEFPINKAIVYEKVDGSIMRLYHDGSKWCVATRGMAFAEGTTSYNDKITFFDVFMDAIQNNPNQKFTLDYLCCDLPKNYTYVFEMVSPLTRVVKPYDTSKIYFIGLINNDNLNDYAIMPKKNNYAYQLLNKHFHGIWYIPKVYRFNTLDDMIKSARELTDFDEGYVAVYHNEDFVWRLKIKSPAYLAIAHLRGNGVLSEKNIIRLILLGEHEEYLTMFENDRQFFDPWIDKVNHVLSDIKTVYDSIKHIEVQKEFALKAIKYSYSSVLFELRKGKTEIVELLLNMNHKKLYEIIEDNYV